MLKLQKRTILDLRKDVQTAATASGLFGQQANVVAVFDRSGSMDFPPSRLYSTGQVQNAADRCLALAAEFDDDGKVPVIAFHNRCFDCGEMDMKNGGTFIKDNIIDRISEGGTSYAPVMRLILERYKNPPSTGGMFGMGSTPGKAKQPTYVLFFTDGDNDDHAETQKLILESRKHAIFWQFVGLGQAQFTFLKKLDTLQGAGIDNANFFHFHGNEILDVDLYKALLVEFPIWLKLAKKAGLV